MSKFEVRAKAYYFNGKQFSTFMDRIFNIIKMAILPTLDHGFSVVSIQILAGVFIETDKSSLKFMQRTQNSQNNFEKQNGGSWLAELVRHPTQVDSGHDPRVVVQNPASGSVLSTERA